MEKREALSPPYTKPIEGKVFSQGPKGVPPLFQSLPNININSVRSQMHFPSSMVSVLIYFFKKIRVGMQLIYLFKVKNRNSRKRCEICSILTIKTHLFLVSLLLTLNKLFLCFFNPCVTSVKLT